MNPQEIISINIQANIKLLTLFQPSIEALCQEFGFDQAASNKVALATEEVFAYCVNLIQRSKNTSRINMSLQLIEKYLIIFIEHKAPCGSLEIHFLPGTEKHLKRTSFEALGLYIAKEIIDKLIYTYSLDGTSRFTLKIALPHEGRDAYESNLLQN